MPIRVASEAWPRPGLAEPRSASIAGFGNGTSFINITGKDCHDRDKQVQGTSFWVRFWHLKLIWFLETELGPPLFEALIANAVFLCDADALLHWNSAAEEGAWGGLKTGPPRRHQIQPVEGPVLDPRAKETYLKRGQKVDPLEIKSGPLWRVQFWPLHCGKSVEAFISSWSWFDQQQLRLESWTGEAPFCAPAFSYVVRTKKGPLLCHTCTWFVTRKAPCYLAVTWERRRTKILKGLCGVIGWFQVAAWVTFKIVL